MISHAFTASTIAASVFALTMFTYWALWDTEPPVKSVSVELLNEAGQPTSIFRRGDLMVISRENCSSKQSPVMISRALIRGDGFQYVMPSGTYVFEVGCKTSVNGVALPTYLIPGHYEYWVTIQYHNNPITDGQVLLKVPELTVVP